MTNPTSNFGWQMPTPTDLVTDLPADFEIFGQAVDTSMADLKGGTTGQILSKATNTDMDFTWITNDVGDITAVNVTAPITGGGSSGAVTIGVSAASTAAAGVVQLSDSTSTTSSVLASTPTATKSAYNLADTANTTANAAIAKSTVTTAGDIIYRNATVPTRLGIGTANQVLAVNSGATAPEWKTVSSGALTLVASNSFSAVTSVSFPNSTFTSTYRNYRVYFVITSYATTSAYTMRARSAGSDLTGTYYDAQGAKFNNSTTTYIDSGGWATSWPVQLSDAFPERGEILLDVICPNTGSAINGRVFQSGAGGNQGAFISSNFQYGYTSFDSLSFIKTSGTMTGFYRVYGLAD